MRTALAAVLLALCTPMTVEKAEDGVVVKSGAVEVLKYQTKRPEGSKLSVESACYFHPLSTPSGIPVTDAAPDDHKHHRGVFLAWVEMHGKKDADFWGWGQHAPKDKRVIVNKEIAELKGGEAAGFRVRNEWQADGVAIAVEDLAASLSTKGAANVLDLTYTITADEDLKLSQWAFSGFCLRTRKDGAITVEGPEGPVKRPDPKHTDPKSDWPASPWYGFTIALKEGKTVGAAVVDHPKNPPSLWHVVKGIGMLNPCIVAPAAVTIKAKEPLVLRYRVVAQDGALSRDLLDELAQWK